MRHALCVATVLAVVATCCFGQFSVTGVVPGNATGAVSPAASVVVTFGASVDPATVSAQSVRVVGRWSGPVPGALSTSGNVVTFTPSRPLFAAEQGTVMVSSHVKSVGGVPLVGGFTATWLVDSVASSGTLVLDHVVNYRGPGEGLIRTYGFFAGDVDGDGSPDMSATNEVSYDVRVRLNNGAGTFGAQQTYPLPSGEEPSPNEGADLDGDGRIDLVTGNQNGQSVGVFINNGAGGYLPPVIYPVGGQVHGVAVLDVEGDGDIDIVVPNFSNLAVLKNQGNGTFAAATFQNGGGQGEWCIAAGDANGDGWTDLFSGNFLSSTVVLLLNDGAGNFTASATRNVPGNPWQMAAADVDGDGALDCVVASNNNSSVTVLRGTGAGGLMPGTTYPVGSFPVSVDLGDLDGDDDTDIVVSNFGSGDATVLRNQGAGVFGNPSTLAASTAGSCAVIVDYDRDGDTDVILVDELDDRAFVYRQVGPNPPGVQPPSLDGALRINSLAGRAGYGGAPPLSLPIGSVAFVNISGAPSQALALALGSATSPGLATPSGLVNLALSPLPIFLVDGFSSPGAATNGFGEALFAFPLPPSTAGVSAAFQALVGAPALPSGVVLTNPEAFSIQ